jgi:hypothetical protein
MCAHGLGRQDRDSDVAVNARRSEPLAALSLRLHGTEVAVWWSDSQSISEPSRPGPMKRLFTCSFVVFVILCARQSRADLPALAPCEGKAVGAACTITGTAAGTCQCTASSNVQGTCYSCPTSAASEFSSCVVCTSSASPGTGGSSTSVDAGSLPTSADSGACAVGRGSVAGSVAPWLMAGTFSILFFVRRRRRGR